jgi:hypothetical protein
MSRRLEYKHTIVFHLHAVAALASAQGQSVRSAWLRGAGESLMRDIGTGLGPLERHHYGPCVSAARTLLDEAAWEAAFAGGWRCRRKRSRGMPSPRRSRRHRRVRQLTGERMVPSPTPSLLGRWRWRL